MAYENIRIVLVNTSHPGNIGGVARAMKNMCLQDLVLVDPIAEFPSGKATARASGAVDILEQTRVVATLDEAIADCQWVVGASARLRTIPWPLLDARDCAVKAVAESESHRVAIVLGRENSGLTNEELEKCHHLVHIPANAEYSSLNIAAAAQVLAYEVHIAHLAQAGKAKLKIENDYPRINAQELEGLYQHFEQALMAIDFYDPDNPRQLMRRLRRLFNRAELDRMELNILRGILSAAEAAQKRR
ncbi:MAG: tRNA (cytosine(32)/uridine(32)-2'-O)-methyltransferase TrmJ [Gammaproteobacteria bacterium]|nr:tRNA (cytosine(32)/uridine(32)-2'-O)-methyltransferase TrmJ [Gammaproteobacteria bacterium]